MFDCQRAVDFLRVCDPLPSGMLATYSKSVGMRADTPAPEFQQKALGEKGWLTSMVGSIIIIRMGYLPLSGLEWLR